MKKIFGLLILSSVIGCASNPHKAKEIDTTIEKSDAVNDEKIGVKDGNLVVQKKVMMNEELRRLQNDVYEQEDKVYGNRKYGSLGLYGSLKECKKKLSSKEFGGDGKLIWTEPMDRVTDKEEEFNIGLEKDKIVGVSEEFLKDRIDRFKKYKNILNKREDEYEEKMDVCEAALEAKKHNKEAKATKADDESSN